MVISNGNTLKVADDFWIAIAFIEKINKMKPASAKGRFVTTAAVSLTMSPSVKIDTQEMIDIK